MTNEPHRIYGTLSNLSAPNKTKTGNDWYRFNLDVEYPWRDNVDRHSLPLVAFGKAAADLSTFRDGDPLQITFRLEVNQREYLDNRVLTVTMQGLGPEVVPGTPRTEAPARGLAAASDGLDFNNKEPAWKLEDEEVPF